MHVYGLPLAISLPTMVIKLLITEAIFLSRHGQIYIQTNKFTDIADHHIHVAAITSMAAIGMANYNIKALKPSQGTDINIVESFLLILQLPMEKKMLHSLHAGFPVPET